MPLNYLDDPKEFANYQLVAEIGEGPMGTVYKAKSRGVEGFEKTFCVKVISPQLATREEFVESLIEEAKQAVDLSHANVAQVHDLGQEESEGTFYIASEYVNGLDLGYALEVADAVDRDWPGDLSIYIASEIAQALDYAHQQKDFNFNSLDLVHRDLRPTNVLISYDGEVNVTDFGIAGALETLPTDDHPAPFRKFEYAAPEWARGEEYTQKSDIYSLGLIIYEMLAGEHPFELSDAPLRRAAAHAEYPPISETVDIPQKVRNTVEGMLHPRPDARIARASTVYEELIGYLYENDLRADNRALSALMDELRQNEQAVADQREGSEAGVEELTASEVSDFYDKSSATLSRDITDLKEAAESQGGGDPTAELDLSEIDLPVDGDPELPGGLENAYASARAGEGRVVLLSGQFGRGPEYLPDRLVEVLGLRQEARVFDVQTNADDEFRPFGAVADLLLTSAGGSADRSDRHEAALTTLAHRGTSQSARDLLRELWGLPRPAPSGDNARRVSDLTETLIDELAGRAGEGPVGIVIDGVERLDPESIDVLRELVAEIDRLPVLMILATHADERMRETFDVGSPDALKPMRVSSEDGTLAPELPEDLSATAEDLLLVLALAERPLPIDEAAAVLGADSDRIQTASDELMEAKLVRSPRPGVMMADFAEGSLWSRRHFDPDRVESVARALAGLFADRRPTDGPTLLDPAIVRLAAAAGDRRRLARLSATYSDWLEENDWLYDALGFYDHVARLIARGELGAPSHRTDQLLDRAELALTLSRFDEARASLEPISSLTERTRQRRAYARSQLLLGRLHLERDDLHRAQSHLERAATLADTLEATALLRRARLARSEWFAHFGDFPRAQSELEAALTLAERPPRPDLEVAGRLHLQAARVYTARGMPDRASTHAAALNRLARESERPEIGCRATLAVAAILEGRGRADEAAALLADDEIDAHRTARTAVSLEYSLEQARLAALTDDLEEAQSIADQLAEKAAVVGDNRREELARDIASASRSAREESPPDRLESRLEFAREHNIPRALHRAHRLLALALEPSAPSAARDHRRAADELAREMAYSDRAA